MNPFFAFSWAAWFQTLLILTVASTLYGEFDDQVDRLPAVLAMVNDEPLLRDHVLHGLKKGRHAVVRYFQRQHGIEPGPGFWHLEARFGGECPFTCLLRRSLEDGIEDLVLQQLAVANGVLETDPVSMEERLRAYNQRRRRTLEEGGLVYGPKHFTALAFHDHYLALLKLDLEALLFQGELALPPWAHSGPEGALPSTLDALVRELRDQSKITILVLPEL